jgi:hypothetical protein
MTVPDDLSDDADLHDDDLKFFMDSDTSRPERITQE